MNTTEYSLYLPSRNDTDVDVDTSLADNFQKINDGLKAHDDDFKDIGINIKKYKSYVLNYGLSNEDWKPAFDAALTEYNKVYVPRGTYQTSTINVPSGKTIYGDGNDTIFKGLNTYVFRVLGTLEAETNISADIPDFTNTINVVSSAGIAVNDFILLKGQRDCLNETDSGEAWTLGYATPGAQGLYFGEYLEVASVNGTAITTKSATVYPFYKNNNASETSVNARTSSTVRKVNFVKDVTFKNFKVEKFNGTAIDIRYGYNCIVDNVSMNANGYTDNSIQFVAFYYSLNCEARFCSFKIDHAITPTEHYYVNIYKCVSSMNCGFFKCYAYNTTQTVDFSYTALEFPCTGCYVDNCTFEFASQSGLTTHGGTFQSRFVNNIIRGCKQGMSIRTRSSIITNNLLTGFHDPLNSYSFGIGLYEGYATDCVVSNNTIVNFATGIGVYDGPDVGESFKYCGAIISNNTIKNYVYGVRVNKSAQNITQEMSIKVLGNIFYGKDTSSSYGVYLTPYTKGVSIKDNTFFGRAVWCDYYVTNVKVISNTIRNATTALFFRGDNTTGNTVFVEYYMNEFFSVTTNVSLGSGCKRVESIQHKHLQFNDKSAVADVTVNNSFFVDSADNLLKFKDNTGVIKVVTLT